MSLYLNVKIRTGICGSIRWGFNAETSTVAKAMVDKHQTRSFAEKIKNILVHLFMGDGLVSKSGHLYVAARGETAE